jgi:hypothetical protein
VAWSSFLELSCTFTTGGGGGGGEVLFLCFVWGCLECMVFVVLF